MPMDINIGDVVELKKQHACGCKEFEITRVGMDIKIKCTKQAREEKTVYTDLQGNIIEVNDGNTFVHICYTDSNVVIEGSESEENLATNAVN